MMPPLQYPNLGLRCPWCQSDRIGLAPGSGPERAAIEEPCLSQVGSYRLVDGPVSFRGTAYCFACHEAGRHTRFEVDVELEYGNEADFDRIKPAFPEDSS